MTNIAYYMTSCLILLTVVFSCNHHNSKENKGYVSEQDTINSSCKGLFDNSLNMKIYTDADVAPEFPGGTSKLTSFIFSELVLPKEQQEVQGKVCVSFVVDSDGKLINKHICEKYQGGYTLLEQNVMKVIDKMPLWKPGKCNNKAIAYRYVLPIYIKGQY